MKFLNLKGIESIKGVLIGKGSEKECFLHKIDNTKCLKMGRTNNCKQIKREIKYFEYLQRTGKCQASFVPKFYGSFKTLDFIGYEHECFLDRSKGGIFDVACPLWQCLKTSNCNKHQIRKELLQLKDEMIKFNIICNDLHEGNIFRVQTEYQSKFVIIDGFGAPELIPICKYVKFVGSNKICRQWEKFRQRIKKLFSFDL